MSTNKTDISQIRKYLNGQLDAKAMHRLEREAQDDPFLMDALEGYAVSGKDQQVNLNELQQRLAGRVAPKKERSILIWRVLPIAAALLVTISIGYLLFKPTAEKQKVASLAIVQPPLMQADKVRVPADSTHPQAGANENAVTSSLLAQNRTRVQRRPQPVITTPANASAPVNEDTVAYTASNYAFYKSKNNTAEAILKKQPGVEVGAIGNGTYQGQQITFGGSNKVPDIKNDTAKINQLFARNALAGRTPGASNEILIRGSGVAKKEVNASIASMPALPDSIDNRQLKAIKLDADSVSTLAEVVVPGYADKSNSPVRPENGWKNYLTYIKQQAVMPDNSIGKVRLAFKVGKDGIIYGIRILNGSTMMINQKAIEILKNGPAWIGGGSNKEIKVKIKFHKQP